MNAALKMKASLTEKTFSEILEEEDMDTLMTLDFYDATFKRTQSEYDAIVAE